MAVERSKKFSYKESKPQSSKFLYGKYMLAADFFTRPLSSLIARALYKTSVTPNQTTVIAFILALGCTLSFSLGTRLSFIAGGILGQLVMIFDTVDGMLARSKNMQSRYGKFLDLYLDRVSELFVFGGMSVGVFVKTGDIRLFGFCVFAVGFHFFRNAAYYIIQHYKEDPKTGQSGDHRAMFTLQILVLSLLGRVDLILILLFLYSGVALIFLLFHFQYEGKRRELV